MILNKKLYKHANIAKSLLLFKKRVFLGQLKKLISKKSISNTQNLYPVLKKDEKGDLLCTSCGLCEKICPTSCIHIIPSTDSNTKIPHSFEIDMLSCIYCGLCSDICFDDAIKMEGKKILSNHLEADWNWNHHQLSNQENH